MLVLRRASPVDDVAQPPGILVQLDLQLAVLVDGELARGLQYPCALAFVLVVKLNLAGGEVE